MSPNETMDSPHDLPALLSRPNYHYHMQRVACDLSVSILFMTFTPLSPIPPHPLRRARRSDSPLHICENQHWEKTFTPGERTDLIGLVLLFHQGKRGCTIAAAPSQASAGSQAAPKRRGSPSAKSVHCTNSK